ncbi:M28 family peptidase [Patulibacter brassicae]|uniref:M28 family peptidase n=1 Tax=Patulibacter brassicae TaxID=1705717 RepID=A0ABU4VL61_9ACTN|nr:M28 family peptidase [Patulibacter brassicae]MDX8152563.1 M28 family peptidase [Patulibacter brassicae]
MLAVLASALVAALPTAVPVPSGTAPPRAAASRATTPSPPAGDAAWALAQRIAARPRPAGSAAERTAQALVAGRMRAAGLTVRHDRFAVPGHGRSRNVVGIRPGRRPCLWILMAHADSMPGTVGALDNASGVGLLVELAERQRAPGCETWFVATGAEERLFTGRPDHLGASALVRRLRRERRTADVRWALSLDEVGRGRRFHLRSPAPRARRGVERALLAAARRARVPVAWRRDEGAGNSDHRELALAGMAAMKLGVVDNACRHRPCDRTPRLQRAAFRRTAAVVLHLLGPVSASSAASRSGAPPG